MSGENYSGQTFRQVVFGGKILIGGTYRGHVTVSFYQENILGWANHRSKFEGV